MLPELNLVPRRKPLRALLSQSGSCMGGSHPKLNLLGGVPLCGSRGWGDVTHQFAYQQWLYLLVTVETLHVGRKLIHSFVHKKMYLMS
jgi:hypothetical protein